jgi:hypothetical protein
MRRLVTAVLALGLMAMAASAARAQNESWESCNESLCIDTPRPDGTGGWKGPVTVGNNVDLEVTALQATSPCKYGTITLTWRAQDFSFVGQNDSSAVCTDPFLLGSVETCSYTDLGHTAKSVLFTFTPENPASTALVTATVHTSCGAGAGTYACVNNSSGEVKVVTSCTVGSNASPCHANDTCVDLSPTSPINEQASETFPVTISSSAP